MICEDCGSNVKEMQICTICGRMNGDKPVRGSSFIDASTFNGSGSYILPMFSNYESGFITTIQQPKSLLDIYRM